jgi:two-component system KDP operon response regulator KdpE
MTGGTGARVLVVEDDPGILRALKTNLTRHGFDVETAETGAEALDAYARRRPDLILLDLGLPDVDGTVVIQEVRARANTPIVVLSVRGAERDKVDIERRRVRVGGEEVHLTPTEYDLLKAFISQPDKVLTDRMLLRAVWGPEYGSEAHYLHVYVARLRRKIEKDPQSPRYLLTEPGVGYRLVTEQP